MQEAIRKSDVLIEALPYIKSYANKVFVIKYGGSSLINPEIKKRVLQDIVFMSYVGIRPILVHGGGPFINEALKNSGSKIEFRNGLRVTTKEDMETVDRVLNRLNHEIADDIKRLGGRGRSLNTDEKGLIKVRRHREGDELGFVGEIDEIDAGIIKKAVRPRAVPVISPVGIGPDKEHYNVNADEVSSKIAIALKAVKLVLLTDVKGIMKDRENQDTLISTLSLKDTEMLIEENMIQGGMIPKVKACTRALTGGVSKTHIIDARLPHSLLLEIFTDKGVGTEIVMTG